jgi:MSHA biogenesis protein MshK
VAARLTRWHRALASAALAACLDAQAAALADPTTPPPGLDAPAAAAGKASNAPARPPARLQMVVRGPGEQRTAVVDGTALRVGDRMDLDGAPARVLRIDDDAVVLDRGGVRRTLTLLPALNCSTAACRNERK